MPASPQVVNDFLTVLRKRTTPQHTKLETAAVSRALLSDDVSMNDYVHYLIKMQAVIAFCEQTIFPLAEGIICDIEARRKLELIRNDLKQLNVSNLVENDYCPFRDTVSTGFALGYMYVIEGSTLGGRVILKQVQSKLGIDENNSGSFFAGYRSLTGSAWKNFLQALLDYTHKAACGDEVIKGAQHAFESIYHYFEA